MANGGSEVPKGKRVISALVDLLAIPILLGIVAGLVLIAVPEGIRNVLLIALNIGWLIFRDVVFSPGRKMVGLKVTGVEGGKVTIGQAFIRNILLMVPFILVIGYIVEIIFVLTKGNRLADGWAKTHVVSA
ncbi:MAG: hypothetical protein A3C35_02790 [Omnitrophica bacterium RIFCSPHIGHO2_02_FULL_46_11]|nr:MAG: hypothetical protein A3C35_02790 [Omnitrophica bacterium RIFCSPHIGHO2_02_FULL_46_11]OGW87633.1 MAG: hypothetical protein A3A81_04795 [Omnitrophica bacterium RIFCSPLOWO2_01_FULL_45_10b]